VAGIGFRLKRLLAEESYGGWIRAHVYGAVVSSGPWLLSICALATLALLAQGTAAEADHTLFQAIVVYTYTFSLLTTGAYQMVITRHLADCLYVGAAGAFLGGYRWAVGATALLHLVLGTLFYGMAPDLAPLVRVIAVALFVLVASTWVAMLFVGAAHNYVSVVLAFLIGNVIGVAVALALGRHLGVAGYLGGFTVGQGLIFFGLHARVEREFAGPSESAPGELWRAARAYWPLALAGLLYYAAISVDRILFWFSPVGVEVRGWFFGSLYDTPLYLAYLSVVPAYAAFLVRVETDFYDHYRRYYGAVIKHGTLRQVLDAKTDMARALRESLGRLLAAQAPVTLGLMILAPTIVHALAMAPTQVSILRAALVGAVLHALALFQLILLFYFDRRRAAVEVAAVFFLGNAGLTLLTIFVGDVAYGQGYALAALLAAGWAYYRLEGTLEDLEYLTFASQPMRSEAA
jgi:uncharacterized membrane protein